MTDADVLKDCALILRAAQGEIAKRRGTIRNDHARKDVDFAIAAIADEIGLMESAAAKLTSEENDEIERAAEVVEMRGRMRRVAI